MRQRDMQEAFSLSMDAFNRVRNPAAEYAGRWLAHNIQPDG